jgi:hypothetical protein
MLHHVDELYFILRSNVQADLGLGVIDEIFIQRKHGWGHPIPAFVAAYIHNQAVKPKRHTKIHYLVDGKTYEEEGLA